MNKGTDSFIAALTSLDLSTNVPVIVIEINYVTVNFLFPVASVKIV